MQSKSFTSLFAVLMLVAVAVDVAQAQAPAKPARVVNRDELRACMLSEKSLAAKRQELEARKTANRDEVVAIRAEATQMAEDQKSVDANDDRKARAFKRVVDAHNARVKAANVASETFNSDLDGLNKAAIAHNEQCAGITFKSEDKEALLKEFEAQKK
jgi:hypothetical protein